MGSEIVFAGKRQFVLEGYQDAPLGPTEVRGRTLATLISPGTELAWADTGNFPLRPGYAAVYEAEEIGRDVKGIARGDRLLSMGGHRSTQQFDQRYVLKLPDGMTPEVAVLARLMGVSTTTLMTTAARPGDKVMVTGAGPVGYLAAHQLKVAGYEVTVVEPEATRSAQARGSGLSVVPKVPVDDPQFAKKVALVIDCSGHEGAVLDACKVVRKRGEVVLVGVPWKAHTPILAHEVLHAVFFGFVTLRSGWEWDVPIVGRDFVWEELYEGYNNAQHTTMTGLAKALMWLDRGHVPTEGLIRSFSPADPAAVYGALLDRKVSEPFVILDWASAEL